MEVALVTPVAEHIMVKVVETNGNEIYFKVRRTTPMKKLMDASCERMGVNRDSVRFLYEGQRVNNEDTGVSLEMEEGSTNIIDAMVAQVGGGGRRKKIDFIVYS